jgi:hypothetical protein
MGPNVAETFDRLFRIERMIEEAARTALARTKVGPWPGGLSHRTDHYEIATNAHRDLAERVGLVLEDAYKAYLGYLPSPGAERFTVRFFAKKEDMDAWRSHTSPLAIVGAAMVNGANLIARARAQAKRGSGPAAERLDAVARALSQPAILEAALGHSRSSLYDFLDEIEALEQDRVDVARGIDRALTAIDAERLLASTPRHGLLGYYAPSSRELCLFETEGWESTAWHEAFHQFFTSAVPHAPQWLNEGLATYFEASKTGGRNEERIAELRSAHEAVGILDRLDIQELVAVRDLRSIHYALAWTLVHYLFEREPKVLAKILHRAKAGQATPLGVLSAFPDFETTQSEWRALTRRVVLGR